MRFSRFSSHYDQRPVTHATDTFAELCEQLFKAPKVVDCPQSIMLKGGREIATDRCPSLTRHPETGARLPNKCIAREGAAWSPAIFDGNGGKNENVIGMGCLVLDLDHLTRAQFAEVDKAIEREGFECAMHSSHSHNPALDDWCLRLVFPVTRELRPSEITPTWEWLQDTIGVKADGQTKDPRRLYYLPTISSSQGAPAYVFARTTGIPVEPRASYTRDLMSQIQSASVSVAQTPSPAPASMGASVLSPEYEPVDLKQLRADLGRSRPSEHHAAMIRRILNGEPLSESGGRDNAIQSLASHFVFSRPRVPLEAWLAIMAPSLDAMEPPEKGTWQEVAFDKLSRAAARKAELDYEAKVAKVATTHSLGLDLNKAAPIENGVTESDRDPTSAAPYSQELITQWAIEHGTDPAGFSSRWIVRHEGANWVFSNGSYKRVLTDRDLPYSLKRDLARAPINLEFVDEKSGTRRPRPMQSILHEYGTVARACEASLSLQKSYYDPVQQTFHEAVCPVRTDIEPMEFPEINEYLYLFAGDVLLDWVSVVTRLDLPAAALYISGPKGGGKNVLADGLARLWHRGGATDFKDVIGSNFNDSLTRCPLIHADEGIAKTPTVMDDLRRLIGSKVRSLNRKFLPTVSITGCPRLLITANNDRVLLDTGASLGPNDIEAISVRVRHIESEGGSVDYLERLRVKHGQQYIQSWVEDDKLARHALWLSQTRKVDMTSRFLVSGSDTTQAERLTTNTGTVAAVMEWACRYLSDPSAIQNTRVRAGGGRLLMNADALLSRTLWEHYVPSKKVLPARLVSEALRSVSESEIVEVEGLPYFQVKPRILLNWAHTNQVGSPAIIEAKING